MKSMQYVWPLQRLAVVFLLCFAMGCSEAVYHGLSERQANEMVVVLQEYGMNASKVRDGAGDDLWIVQVPAGANINAWQVLETQGLPRPSEGGFHEFYPGGGLIPTSGEERIVLQYATAREIQTAILKIEGVVDAHVNLVLPARPRVQLSTETIEPPRASVLVRYRDREGEKPISEDRLKSLVTGGVEGLLRENVEVIMLPSRRSLDPELAQVREPEMAQIGPVSVAEESKSFLQILIFSMGAIILALAALLTLMIARRAK